MGSPPTTTPATPTDHPQQPEGLTEQIEHQMIGAREVRFLTHDVQPPAALYVTQDDGLYCLVSNIQAGVQLNLTATVLLPDGRVQANSWNINPPATGAQTAYLFPLAESFLLNVSVQPASGVRYGQTWIFACVRRGGMASGVNLQTLISDSVDSFGGPTWPGSSIRHPTDGAGLVTATYTAANTAGSQYVFTVPSYARIRLRSVVCSLVASAAVANRTVQLLVYDASAHLIVFDATEPNITASQAAWFSWGLKLGWAQTTLVSFDLSRSLPDVMMGPGYQINLNALNMQAADQFQYVNITYEQWFSF